MENSDVLDLTGRQLRLFLMVFDQRNLAEASLYLPPQKFDLVWHRRVENSARAKWLRKLILSVAEASHYARD